MAETTGNPVTHINQSHHPVNGNHASPAVTGDANDALVILNGNTSLSTTASETAATSLSTNTSGTGKQVATGRQQQVTSVPNGDDPVREPVTLSSAGSADSHLTPGPGSSMEVPAPQPSSQTTAAIVEAESANSSKSPDHQKQQPDPAAASSLSSSSSSSSCNAVPESAGSADQPCAAGSGSSSMTAKTGTKSKSPAASEARVSGKAVPSNRSRHHNTPQHQHQHHVSRMSGNPVIPEMPLRLVVHTDMVGAIIGKGGNTIKDITRESKARVDVLRKESGCTSHPSSSSSSSSSSLDKVINIFGGHDNCMKACSKILEVIHHEVEDMEREISDYPMRLLAHNALIGRVIGKSGATIKRIMESSGSRVVISASLFDPSAYSQLPERVITITATGADQRREDQMSAVIEAAGQIFSKLRTCYESDMAMASAPTHFMSMGSCHPATSGSSSTIGSPSHRMPPFPMSHASSRQGPYSPPAVYGSPYMQSGSGHLPSFMPPYPFHPMTATSPPSSSPSSMSSPFMQPFDPVLTCRETAVIFIPNSCVGGVIGTGGSMIREMMHASGATIKVAPLTKAHSGRTVAATAGDKRQDSPEEQEEEGTGSESKQSERKVTVIGTPESQWKAQMMIFRKVLMDPSITSASSHPSGSSSSSSPPSSSSEPCLRVEILVPATQVGRIIGKNGQTVRELQRLTRASIKLPEPAPDGAPAAPPETEIPVSIMGDFFSSQNAQRQIRALVHRAQVSATAAAAAAAAGGGGGSQNYDYLTGMAIHRIRDDQHPHHHQQQQRRTGASATAEGTGGTGRGNKNKSNRATAATGTGAKTEEKQQESSCDPPEEPESTASRDHPNDGQEVEEAEAGRKEADESMTGE